MATGEISRVIPDKLYFRIGEVCELIRVQPHVLRYWESEFPMLAPQKNRAGQRVYRKKDVEMVMRIRDLLYEEKFTIAGARKKLLEESRPTTAKIKIPPQPQTMSQPEPEPPSTPDPLRLRDPNPVSPPTPDNGEAAGNTPESRLAIRTLKRELEDLLTLLKSDASITR